MKPNLQITGGLGRVCFRVIGKLRGYLALSCRAKPSPGETLRVGEACALRLRETRRARAANPPLQICVLKTFSWIENTERIELLFDFPHQWYRIAPIAPHIDFFLDIYRCLQNR